ncbi:hypothetical protein GQX74_013778 [Glossina fuscipes]|nr:hypothetical protein GQX74_013778 [Glossina fuscipes]
MYFDPIREPPHQNSVRLEPCRKIAAIQGHCPLGASMPPTTRPAEYSCWPQSSGSIMFSPPFESNGLNVVLVVGFICGINTRLGEDEGLADVVDNVVDVVLGISVFDSCPPLVISTSVAIDEIIGATY